MHSASLMVAPIRAFVSSRKRRRPDATHRALAVALDAKGNYVDQNGCDPFAVEDAPDDEGKDNNQDGIDTLAIKAASSATRSGSGRRRRKACGPCCTSSWASPRHGWATASHDRDDPRVKQLLKAAIEWANAEMGGVFAASTHDHDAKPPRLLGHEVPQPGSNQASFDPREAIVCSGVRLVGSRC